MGTLVRQPTGIFAITEPDWLPTVTSVEGRFVEASNATLLGRTDSGEQVIYKPVAGARPLWDFDAATLALREVWSCRVDRAMGLGVVPETTMGSGPFGPGAIQRFVEAAADQTVVDMINTNDDAVWPIAVLDIVVNNADRKVGHVLRDSENRLWAIDHGLTFHPEEKLRTVLWGFSGKPMPETMIAALASLEAALSDELGTRLAADLGQAELAALRLRTTSLLRSGHHPHPPDDRPAVPWPPY